MSDTVEFFSKQFNMPKMSSKDETFHATLDLIYALQNPDPDSPLGKLGNGHKETISNLEEIFIKAIPPKVPLRFPVKNLVQKKTKEVNQEIFL